ncbi:MAG: sensor histidine kinase, partial [Bacteroidota bacterium]
MIDEVMSYSILESGEFKLKPGMTDLEEIVQSIVQLYKPSTRLKNISLDVFTENIEEMVFLDADKFEQIMGNMVSNSVKYTKPGGSVKLMLTRNQNTLELAVQDSGVGIPSEKIKMLLSEDTIQPLENGKGTSGEKSTGFGLIIVKHIIKLFEGELDIESEVGQGTKMIVRIPV